MKNTSIKSLKRVRRHTRIRSKISGTMERPRLSIFKSNTAIYAQLIDDVSAKTLMQSSTREIKKGTLGERALEAGKSLATKAKEKGISKVVFDRGGFAYAGVIMKLAEGAREGGLVF